MLDDYSCVECIAVGGGTSVNMRGIWFWRKMTFHIDNSQNEGPAGPYPEPWLFWESNLGITSSYEDPHPSLLRVFPFQFNLLDQMRVQIVLVKGIRLNWDFLLTASLVLLCFFLWKPLKPALVESHLTAGWGSLNYGFVPGCFKGQSRRAHNPEIGSSNLPPATTSSLSIFCGV